MTHLDNLVADSLAQSPDTVVHQLASEIERLRSAIADALRPLYEGGHIYAKPLEDAIRKPAENLFHKNCRSCICWNGDLCELISHICENGEQWRPSAKFVAAHPEVAALADFAEEMRASASRFSVALDAVRAELAARDAEIEALREEVCLTNEHEHAIMVELSTARNEIADLKRGEVVVLTDVVRGVTHTVISWEVSRPGDYYWERGAWREWKADGQMANASSFAWIRPFPVRPIPADRELMRLVDELIRWHGLRPLDKRPDHAAVLVEAIKALRAQATQELAP